MLSLLSFFSVLVGAVYWVDSLIEQARHLGLASLHDLRDPNVGKVLGLATELARWKRENGRSESER